VCEILRKLRKNFTETFQLLNQAYGAGSRVSWAKKGMDVSVKDQGVVGYDFLLEGFVQHKFVPRGQMVNKQLY